MKQILTDKLLGIHEEHPFTCPFINALIFQGRTCSRSYDLEISYNPDYIYVHSDDFLHAVDGLNKWVNDVIGLYENLPEDVKNAKADLEIDKMIVGIRELLDYSVDLRDDERYINDLLDDWLQLHKEHKQTYEELENKRREFYAAKSMVDVTTDSDVQTYRIAERDRLENDVQSLEDKIEQLQTKFSDDFVPLFEDQTEDYSRALESFRTRNDTLREETRALMVCLEMNFKNEFNFEQPHDYLNRKFGIKDSLSGVKTLNIGLIYNNTPFNVNNIDEYDENADGRKYLLKLVDDLCSRNILTSEDRRDFQDRVNPFLLIRADYLEKYGIEKSVSRTLDFQKNMLLDKLKVHGYKMVRFYESIDDYISNKDNFKTVELNDVAPTVKKKTKIKPV